MGYVESKKEKYDYKYIINEKIFEAGLLEKYSEVGFAGGFEGIAEYEITEEKEKRRNLQAPPALDPAYVSSVKRTMAAQNFRGYFPEINQKGFEQVVMSLGGEGMTRLYKRVVSEGKAGQNVDWEFAKAIRNLTHTSPKEFLHTLSDPVTCWGSYILDLYLEHGKNISVVEAERTQWIYRNVWFADGINDIPEESAVIAIGLGHFYNDHGLLKLLMDRGWNVERVVCPAWSATPETTKKLSRELFGKLQDALTRYSTPSRVHRWFQAQHRERRGCTRSSGAA